MTGLSATPIVDGSYYIEAPRAGLRILCGCPENIVKHLIRGGMIGPAQRGGAHYETGPNAILLSESPVEAGCFRNLAEFPVLQMLYRQGMIIPGHPNNDGTKPLIIGLRNQLDAVAAYIYEGNYGLTRASEIVGGGVAEAEAEALLRSKRAFAFGRFKESSELLDLKAIDGPIVELKAGLFLRREGGNRYEFIFEGETVTVDLSATERTPSPYTLPSRPAPSTGFAVVHLGEGDGWDPDRPCMCSLIVAGGERWLVDAGPNIEPSLAAIGLSASDLTGVFHSHVHDDHFVGLTALMRGERKLQYRALPCVRLSATRKLAALAGIGEESFGRFFEVHDLEARRWNSVGGVEVFPIPAPHPVENSLFRFRKAGGGGKCYAHWADLTSFAVMESLAASPDPEAAMPRSIIDRSHTEYLEFAEVKKVDAGGGMIHGEARDFAADRSTELLLSHCPAPGAALTQRQSRTAEFGEVSSLEEGGGPSLEEIVLRALLRRFPTTPQPQLEMLVRESLRAGGGRRSSEEGMALKAGLRIETLYLVLSGTVERIGRGSEGKVDLVAGAIAGERGLALNGIATYDFRPLPGAELFAIPARVWKEFLNASGVEAPSRERLDLCSRFDRMAFFDGVAQSRLSFEAAEKSRLATLAAGEELPGGKGRLWIILDGSVEILSGGQLLETAGPGGIFGDEETLNDSCCLFTARAASPTLAAQLDLSLVAAHPILLWRAKEVFERRLASAGAVFTFSWRDEYDVGIESIDLQHKAIFRAIEALLKTLKGSSRDFHEALQSLVDTATGHYADEERMLAGLPYPGLEEHRRAHDRLKEYFIEVAGRDSISAETDAFMKDRFIRHTLIMDRKYLPYLRG